MTSFAKTFLRIPVSALLAFFLVASGLFALDIANAPKALADECTGASAMECIGTAVSSFGSAGNSSGSGIIGGGNSGGGSAPVPVGPGGQVAPTYFSCLESPEPPRPQSPIMIGCQPEYRVSIREGSFVTPLAPCPATKMVSGFEVKLKKQVYITTDRLHWGLTMDSSGRFMYSPYYVNVSTQNICIYPEVNLSSEWYDCIVSWNVHVDKIAGRVGVGNNLAANSGSTGWGNAYNSGARGENLPSTCETSRRVGLGYTPPTGQPGWGQYRASGYMMKANCTRGGISFDGATTYSWRCDPPRSVQAPTNYVTIACFGVQRGLVNADWTGKDCYNRPGFASCTVPNGSKLNGFAGNVQAIRDGNDNALDWAAPSLVGNVRGDSNWQTRTNIVAGSTPWNTDAAWNSGSQQLFRYSGVITGNQWNYGGKRLNEQLAFYAAGDNGYPFQLTREYRYDADFLTQQGSITSFDLTSGDIGTSSYATWVRIADNYCGPNSSPAISVVRAIGDSVQ